MTRTYALKRLLEHGDMTRAEILIIMGGVEKSACWAISSLCKHDIARKKGYAWFKGVKSPLYGLKNV